MKRYRIKKGKVKPNCLFVNGTKPITIVPELFDYRHVVFGENCKYITRIGEKWKWHTLFGYKYMNLTDEESVSIVWRYNQTKRKFEIASCATMYGSKSYTIIGEGESESVIHVGLDMKGNKACAFGNRTAYWYIFHPRLYKRPLIGMGIRYGNELGVPHDMTIYMSKSKDDE